MSGHVCHEPDEASRLCNQQMTLFLTSAVCKLIKERGSDDFTLPLTTIKRVCEEWKTEHVSDWTLERVCSSVINCTQRCFNLLPSDCQSSTMLRLKVVTICIILHVGVNACSHLHTHTHTDTRTMGLFWTVGWSQRTALTTTCIHNAPSLCNNTSGIFPFSFLSKVGFWW